MRASVLALSAALGLTSATSAQRFGFTHGMVPGEADSTVALALADLDGDGDVDAFVGVNPSAYYGLGAGPIPGQGRLHRNDGAGVFADDTAASLPALPGFPNAVAAGDVDGDGDSDLLVGIGGPNQLLINGGAGTFTDVAATNLPPLSGNTFAAALGDVDGDGDLDALLGTFGQNRLLLNSGTGVFADATATNLPALTDQTFAFALGDVDGDGDLDALVGNSNFTAFGGRQSRLYLNNGAGDFADATATSLPALLANTRAVALGDVDGDGDLDAFLGNIPVGAAGGQNRLYLNGGTGIFADATATNLPPLVGWTRAVALGDVDADGDLDAFLGNGRVTYGLPAAMAEQNRLLLNNGAGGFADATATNLPGLPDNTNAVALADVDGDGDLDAFLGNAGSEFGQDRLYLNDGSGVFTDGTEGNPPLPLDPTNAAALGDLDGDGDLDAFVGNDGDQARLFLNDGTGVLLDATATGVPTLLSSTRAVALGDLDGDGDLDAYLGNLGQQDLLYVNGGTGVFADATATNLPALTDPTFAVALGDVDGDGDLDVFVGNSDYNLGQQNRLYLNAGSGAFTDATATNLPILIDDTRAVALGDLDGDGDLDALVGNWDYGAGIDNRLYLNVGAGVFSDATATNLPASPLDRTNAVALGDADGDGDLDAFVGNSSLNGGGPEGLYLNGGAGTFTDATGTNLPAAPPGLTTSVALGDFEGDGDLDAFAGKVAQGPVRNRLYLNGGGGLFTDSTVTDLPALTDWTSAVALGDLDDDGDLDAFAGVRGLDRLYTNLTRQLAWRGIPRAGKPLTLDLRGPASGTWLLAASPGSASIPLPPFGTLRLFPPTLFIVAGGALDPQGRASLPLPVPANPTLVGLSLYWQAVVGPPFRFTNLEITTVTNL
ncbi:MAG: VCBS repeat-containing protein [Planctomycetes bacterium]|nr:VCBS repeat-containing protein [Planctomycetota bacterium]